MPTSYGPAGGWFDVVAYGATGDGSTPSHGPIQAAIIDAAAGNGGVVWLPRGTYRLRQPLTIPRQVSLLGAGWQKNWETSNGSWLYVDEPGVTALSIQATGTVVSDLGIVYRQPEPTNDSWLPGDYPFAIEVAADDVLLRNLHLYNPTHGIRSYNAGRTVFDRIWGRPLTTGILIDAARDVVKVNNTHFWPFWAEGNPHVTSYQDRNAVGIVSLRNDNPHFSNLFVFGYSAGLRCAASDQGHTSKFRLVNADFDLCRVGLEVVANHTTGQAVNLTCQGSEAGEAGIKVAAEGVVLQASNVRVNHYCNNGIRIEGKNSLAQLDNVWVADWNRSQQGFPGIEAFAARIQLGTCLLFHDGHGAPDYLARRGGSIDVA